MNRIVKNIKEIEDKYGFKVAETNVCALIGNTDQCNLWFGETRPDLTPDRIIEFVKDLNIALELETPYKLRDLIDGDDWQEIADICDASEDARWRKNQI